jgi:hypothetical protein
MFVAVISLIILQPPPSVYLSFLIRYLVLPIYMCVYVLFIACNVRCLVIGPIMLQVSMEILPQPKKRR